MSSSNVVNFSLRQNKAIERGLVFEGVRRMLEAQGISDAVYVGFGSVWFTDFQLAHRDLAISTMVSIEADPVVFKRAQFNRPFRSVEVLEGYSSAVLPELLVRPDLAQRPWVLWLDYDKKLDEEKLDELSQLIGQLPRDSFLITTFAAKANNYSAKPDGRFGRLQSLFGSAAPATLDIETARDDIAFAAVLAECAADYLAASAYSSGNEYRPAFRMVYQDGIPMGTVGGYLPAPTSGATATALIANTAWPGFPDLPIITPPLTHKEVIALQSLLPHGGAARPCRADIQSLGFDLEDEQIASFVDHYLRFPSFVQIAR